MELMFRPFARYADFNGRARRSEYWLWCLFLFLANAALTAIQFAVIGGTMGSMAASGSDPDAAAMGAVGGMMIMNLVKLAFALAVLIPSIAVAVRRFHDTGRTGWWILFPTGVMIVAMIVYISVDGANFMREMQSMEGMAGNPNDPAAALRILGAMGRPLMWVGLPTLAAKLVTFVFRVMDGTPGNNRFGPDPKGRGAATAAVF